MAGKKGMKMSLIKDQSPRCIEYYVKNFPELSLEECEQKLKTFKRSCNYQCIEFYERKYPELSHEEHVKLREQTLQQKRINNPLNLEYYKHKYPNLSSDEQNKLWHEYTRKNNYQCKEYYLNKGMSIEEAEILKNEKTKIATDKISKKVSGELNGMHSSKTSQEKRNSISPKRIEFYERKYPELSHEEHLKMLQDQINKTNNSIKINHGYNTTIEYYLNKGMTIEEAKEALCNRQATFSLYKCIKKYGEERGLEIFNNRQKIWNKKLQKAFKSGKFTQSPIANELFDTLINRLNLNQYVEEKYIFNDTLHKGYLFDFCYKNKLIEFNGDYWHANPKFYEPKSFIKAKNKRAELIWEYDKIKIKTANDQGYKTLIIWEYDYRNNKEATLQKCIDFLNS